MVMPDDDSPPPFFGLRPARTIVGRTVHRVVRRMLASAMKPGVIAYNEMLASHDVAPIPLDGFPQAPMASARRVFLNGSPGLEFPGYRPPPNAEFVGALVPARGTIGLDTQLPPPVLDPDARVVLVSQGTVDNTDPTKLIVPTLEALADGPFVVVATTGGVQTAELRTRFASSERRHRGLHRLRRVVPAPGRGREQLHRRQRPRGDAERGARGRRRQERGQERRRRAHRLQPSRHRSPDRAARSRPGSAPRCVGCSTTRRTQPTSTPCGPSSSPTTPVPVSRPRSTTSRWRA